MSSSLPPAFPSDFIFGTATAAYQVEGAAAIDGRGPSIWDTFTRLPGRVLGDQNADVSVDQYHRYPEDVKLMQWMGVGAYRFSISWSRVMPEGRGRLNAAGLDYYDRLVDTLLAAGITPWATLFHWDLPQALEDAYGGWRSPKIADDFAAYATVVAGRLSDRVKHFFTINEFMCFIDKGYGWGPVFDAFAPGLNLPRRELLQARHHALLAHGRAVQALRAAARQPLVIGLADNPIPCCPVIETPENIDAARQAFRELNAHYLTAVMEGRYLDCYLETEGADAPRFTGEEMRTIASPLDFVGVNMYSPSLIRARGAAPGYEVVPYSPSHPTGFMPWLKHGAGIAYWTPRFARELWNVGAFYITENGCAADDQPTLDRAEVLDTDRVEYLRHHFAAAARAVAEGYPLKGYFVWSLLDNFEWAYGFTRRFGLVYVNYSTLARTPKLSAEWYRQTIRARRVL